MFFLLLWKICTFTRVLCCSTGQRWRDEGTLRYIDAGLTLAYIHIYIYTYFTSSTSLFKCSSVDDCLFKFFCIQGGVLNQNRYTWCRHRRNDSQVVRFKHVYFVFVISRKIFGGQHYRRHHRYETFTLRPWKKVFVKKVLHDKSITN